MVHQERSPTSPRSTGLLCAHRGQGPPLLSEKEKAFGSSECLWSPPAPAFHLWNSVSVYPVGLSMSAHVTEKRVLLKSVIKSFDYFKVLEYSLVVLLISLTTECWTHTLAISTESMCVGGDSLTG